MKPDSGMPYSLSFMEVICFAANQHNAIHGTFPSALDPLTRDCNTNTEEPRGMLYSQSVAETVCFISTYDRCRTIYTVTPELWDGLKDAKFPSDFPTSHLKIPRPAMCIVVPNDHDPNGSGIAIFLHINSFDNKDDRLALRIALVPGEDLNIISKWNLELATGAESGDLFPCPMMARGVLPLHTTTLDESWATYQSSIVYVDSSVSDQQSSLQFETQIVGGVLNLLLYMQGEDDLVQIVHPGRNPQKPLTNNPKKAAKRASQALLEPHSQFLVGRKYARVIQHWMEEQSRDNPLEGSHASPKPHMRSAHAHIYWTGTGRKTPIVKYLPPIPVKGGDTLEEKVMSVQ